MERKIQRITPRGIYHAVPRLKHVAAYVRVSSGKETMLHSFSAQVSYYSGYIQRHKGWQYVGVYTDEAVTGTKNNRAEFERLLADCRAGKIDVVLTKSISRFARNTLTLLETVRELRLLGVDVYFEEQNIHSMSGDGELLLTILASYAQEESRSVSENCKWRLRNKFKEGKPNNFTVYGYHVSNGELTVNEPEAVVVRRVFADYLNGNGMTLIANRLNVEGYRTRNGVKWNASKVRTILKNEKYVGDLLLQKEYVADHLSKKKRANRGELPKYLVTDNHKAIISRVDFEQVQRRIGEQAEKYAAKISASEPYQFTGKINCGICGKSYRRKLNNVGTPYQKPVWICSTFNSESKSACASKQIPENILDEISAGFEKEIRQIVALPNNFLRFVFMDGTTAETQWQDRSRRESWTEEMKQAARERQIEMIKNRRGNVCRPLQQ
jgi:resolvase domain protein